MKASHFSEDTLEFIRLLARHGVNYVIVGGEAVIYHGHARLTGDVDFFYGSSPENAARLFAALTEFWKGPVPGMTGPADLLAPGVIFQFGVPPNRIDLVSRISGVEFKDAWAGRVEERIEGTGRGEVVWLIGLDEIIRNKAVAGRHKDLEDLEYLQAKKRAKAH